MCDRFIKVQKNDNIFIEIMPKELVLYLKLAYSSLIEWYMFPLFVILLSEPNISGLLPTLIRFFFNILPIALAENNSNDEKGSTTN